jgi:phage repressor protein C with HTH and peptisase S24 domain
MKLIILMVVFILLIPYIPTAHKLGVLGNSMAPTYPEGSAVWVTDILPIREGDVAVFSLKSDTSIIKRVIKVSGECYWVGGDNKQDSLDSREFGWLCSEDLESKMRVL